MCINQFRHALIEQLNLYTVTPRLYVCMYVRMCTYVRTYTYSENLQLIIRAVR